MRSKILAFLVALAFSLPALAQQMPPLPTDPKVKVGKLDNGLTYYIRSNAEPKGQAEFYIVQRVGSILEEESQRGLAHFLEHMAFNGTKNFKGKNMINWLEKNGVKFGANLNAYTSFDETVYNISNVPIAREAVLDSCLLILHDWSNFITLDNTEIDNERGVIREEWRTRSNANLRMIEKMITEAFEGSQYANRMPIGLMDVVNNFKYQEIKDYYKKWYRPDLQSIVVVGDFDADKVEAKVKSMFSDIAKPVNPAERTIFKVNDNEAPIVSINTDPEANNTQIMVFFKRDQMPTELRPTVASIVSDFMSDAIQKMLNARYAELTQKANPPFTFAVCQDGNFFISQTKDAFTLVAGCQEGGVDKAIVSLVNEAERARKFGFTASEYERAKSDILKEIETQFKDKEKQKNGYYVQQYVQNFITGSPIPGIDTEYAIYQQLAKALPVAQVNQFAAEIITEKNMVVGINGPSKAGLTYPTKDEVVSLINKARTENVTAYEDKVSNEPLITTLPKAGKIVKEEKDAKFDATVWTLSNGAKVIVKKTDFKDDEVVFTATSKGGTSLFDNKDVVNFKVINDIIDAGGLGNFSATDLPKILAGKKASVSAGVDSKASSLNGSCSPKDLETMMQLTYLTVTAPRADDEAVQSYLSRTKAMLSNMEAQPMVAFSDSLTKAIYQGHPRSLRLKASDLEKVDYKRCMEIYKKLYSNAGNFVFTFVGNIDVEKFKPLVEQYIASLPSTKKKEVAQDIKMNPRKGEFHSEFEKEMKTPKATVYTIYTGKMEYNVENQIKLRMLNQLLDIIYTESIREQEGGTYGVSARASVSNYPVGNFTLLIGFDTDPKLVEKLQAKVKEELANITKNGVKEADLAKSKEYLLKNYKENQRDNGYWVNSIDNFYTNNIDGVNGYEAKVNAVTVADIKAIVASIISQKNRVEVIMKGVAKK